MEPAEIKVKAVLLDMGKVLVDYDHERGWGALGALLGAPGGAVRDHMLEKGLIPAHDRGDIRPAEFRQAVCEPFGPTLPAPDFDLAWGDIFTPIPGTLELVSRLHGRIPMVLLSNTDPLHWAFIQERFDFPCFLTGAVLSFQERCLKPEPGIYLAAAQRAGCRPEECLFFDDRPDNVEGAQRVGIRAHLFTHPGVVEAALWRERLLG